MASRRLLPLLCLALTACPEDFAPTAEAIIGSWELQTIPGLGENCVVNSGELEIAQNSDGSYTGDFEFSASCGDEQIDERADLTSLDVEEPNAEYSLELLRTLPSPLELDWECDLTEPELRCTESGPGGLLIFEFRREDG